MGGPGSGKPRGEDFETFPRSGLGKVDGRIWILLAAAALFLGGGCECAPSCCRAAAQDVNTRANISSYDFETRPPFELAHLSSRFAFAWPVLPLKQRITSRHFTFDDKSEHNHSYLQSSAGLKTLCRHADSSAPGGRQRQGVFEAMGGCDAGL